MTQDIFDKLETDIMKVLTKEPEKSFTQYELYANIFENYDVKDPIEKENLKIRFLIVLRKLSSIFEDVRVFSKNGILNATFNVIDDLNYSSDTKYEKDICEDDSSEEEFKEDISNMPSEISVIRFIVDENIEKYFNTKDFEGNTILHKLISYNDFERFKKIYLKNISLLDEINNNNKKPLDLVTDIRFSNLLISDLIDDGKNAEYELMDIKDRIRDLEKYLSELFSTIKIMYQVMLLYIITLIIKYIITLIFS
jgi:hypothetical protein